MATDEKRVSLLISRLTDFSVASSESFVLVARVEWSFQEGGRFFFLDVEREINLVLILHNAGACLKSIYCDDWVENFSLKHADIFLSQREWKSFHFVSLNFNNASLFLRGFFRGRKIVISCASHSRVKNASGKSLEIDEET